METHPPGSFCWAELTTTDGEAAKAFYTELFGWSSHDDPIGEGMVYSMLQHEGRNAGALYGMGPEMQKMGIPPHWMLYVTVADLEEAVGKARSLGASVPREPMDVMGIGRMAVLADPTGAHLALWQPIQSHGFQVADEPGSFCWGELLTRDPDKAKAFYTGLFGWNAKDSGSVGGNDYIEWENGGKPIGGLFAMGAEMAGVPASWMGYFMVADCDATAVRAKELGGTWIKAPDEIPDVGRFAVLQDPQGAVFSLYER